MKTFFRDDDYRYYLGLLTEARGKAGVEVWAYCTLPNHVHLLVVPDQEDSMARLFRFVHRHYSGHVNFSENWKSHLWQERFHSFVMDEHYLMATVRYTELNPVRARLCERPEEWPWSSARAHMVGCDDAVVSVLPTLERVNDWRHYLSEGASDAELEGIRRCASTGRPAGDVDLLDNLETLTGRDLKKRKPGRKPAIR